MLPKRPPREPAQPPINFSESAHAAAEPPVRRAQAAGCLTWLPPARLEALSTAERRCDGRAREFLFLREALDRKSFFTVEKLTFSCEDLRQTDFTFTLLKFC